MDHAGTPGPRPFLLFLLLLTLPGAVLADGEPTLPADRYRLVALSIDEPLTLDGRLIESAWQEARPATDFTIREPRPGEPSTEHTEVRVVYTPKVLYIGVVAHSSEPDALVAKEMQRDGGLFRDESVVVLFDTFDDDRNAYFFEFNALGARSDSLVTDEGRDVNFEWDGVWDVATRRTEDGWTAEVAIPFWSLRFDPSASSWGFNVRRVIRHKNEITFWAPIPLEANIFRVSLFGSLEGITDVEQGAALNVKPFIVASSASAASVTSDVDDGENSEIGLDVKWGVTRGLSLDLTVNTDFAETEVDEQQVNLTRFSLFFPEKREFFLENAGIFEFGPGGGRGRPLLQTFFSRRIGIGEDGQQVPIEWGARLTGRIGDWNLGFLDVQTAAFHPEPGDDLEPVERDNWGAFRLKRNVGQRSSVGIMATNRQGDDTSNRVFGADVDWKFTDKLSASGFYSTSDDSLAGTDDAFGAGVEFNGAILDWNVSAVEIGERFEPDMGFLLRQGVRQFEAGVEYEPRPDSKLIRNYSYEFDTLVVTTLDGTVETSEIRLDPFSIRFESEDSFTFFFNRNFERLFEPFEIIDEEMDEDDVTIPVGEYTFNEYGIRFGTNDSRLVSVRGRLQTGGFFDGDRDTYSLTLSLRPNRFIRSETRWEKNEIELPEGAFETTVLRQRLGLALNPRLRADTFIQYNDLDENVSLNLRVNWIYKPGADLFVVFNESWDAPGLGDLMVRDRQVVVKFTYLYQR